MLSYLPSLSKTTFERSSLIPSCHAQCRTRLRARNAAHDGEHIRQSSTICLCLQWRSVLQTVDNFYLQHTECVFEFYFNFGWSEFVLWLVVMVGGWGQTEEERLPLPQPGPHPILFPHVPRSTSPPTETPTNKEWGLVLRSCQDFDPLTRFCQAQLFIRQVLMLL